jgi:hypothetical protein
MSKPTASDHLILILSTAADNHAHSHPSVASTLKSLIQCISADRILGDNGATYALAVVARQAMARARERVAGRHWNPVPSLTPEENEMALRAAYSEVGDEFDNDFDGFLST